MIQGMSETQGQGGAVATSENGAAPFAELLTRPFYGMRVSPRFSATRFEKRPVSSELAEVVDRIRYTTEIVPCLCCENPPQIRSNHSDAMKDATLYGVGMWNR